MNWFLITDNIVSVALVVVCWWLAHQNSIARLPLKRSIGVGYSVLAMTVLASMLVRNLCDMRWLVPYVELTCRVVLTITLVAVAVRLARLYASPPGH